jgi:hypothetical protein
MPYVGINGNISGDSGIVSGSTLTKDIAGLGTWSWSATGSYVWNWYTSLNYGVNLQSYSFVITTTVTVNAPAKVEWNNYEFDVPINISQVTNFYGAQFDVLFDSTVLQYVSATWGQIGTTPLTGSGTTQSSPIIGGHRFLLSISNLQGGISGSGTIVTIRFRVIGSIGQSSPINLANGQLSDFNAQAIPAAWINASVLISVIPGDANGDGVMNVLDMTKTAREILLLDPLTPGADANLDGNVNVLDMTKIARIILGLDSQ